MIAGPEVLICNECVQLALEILVTEGDGFENKELSVEIHSDLCTIEKLNHEAFKNIGAYIKGVMHTLQTMSIGGETQNDTE